MKALRTRHIPGYLSPREIEALHGVEVRRINKLFNNHPNFIKGRLKPNGDKSRIYYIPETEVSKLFFLKGKQKS